MPTGLISRWIQRIREIFTDGKLIPQQSSPEASQPESGERWTAAQQALIREHSASIMQAHSEGGKEAMQAKIAEILAEGDSHLEQPG